MKKSIVFAGYLIAFLLSSILLNAQDPLRFENEINQISQLNNQFSQDQKVVVFTGSSSIRMWKDVQSYFPEVTAVNTGFGGSHMSDLLYFLDKTVLRFNPDILFIYEGDNDISAGKKPKEILKTTKAVINKLREEIPETKIILISPKPSIARWNLEKQYLKLNGLLKKFSEKEGLGFANVWAAMLNEDGTLKKEIFLNDGLHMKKQGYDLWYEVLKNFMD